MSGLGVSCKRYSRPVCRRREISIYFCDPDDFKGFMLGGEAEIVEDRELKHKMAIM